MMPTASIADEGGISFWLPGQYASFVAVPGAPGWSFASIYYHTSVDAGGSQEFPQGGQIRAGLDGDGDLFVLAPAYTLEEPILGGRASFSVAGIFGRSEASVDATLTGPGGGTISGERSDTRTGFGDLYPTAAVRWNDGVHNFMTYLAGDIPVGAYDEDRLANIGIGHGAIDGGVGYTYLNPMQKLEFSILGGLTYNFENPHTDYQNGIDGHIDWGASYLPTETVQVGVAGYFYQQITGDSGEGATLGDFKSRVAGIGPQLGYFFPAGDMQGYANVRGYYEFAAENRSEGWNVYVMLSFSPAPQHAASAK